MTRTIPFTALAGALALAAACNPVVASPITTGGTGGATSASSSNGGATTVGPAGSGSSTSGASTGGGAGAGVRVLADTGPGEVAFIVAAGGFVYWSTGNGPGEPVLWRVATTGGSAAQILTGAPAGYASLVTDGTNLYWSQGAATDGGIYEMPLSGGKQTLLVGIDAGQPQSIAVGATRVYWGSGSTGALMQVPIAGGTATSIATPGVQPMMAYRVAADATNAYWYDPAAAGIYSVPAAGGPVVTLATQQQAVDSLVVGGGWLYWTSAAGLAQVPTGGGTLTVFPEASSLGRDLAVDASDVYWSEGGTQGQTVIKKMPLGGGPVSVILSLAMTSAGCPSVIAVDETNIYWGCAFENEIQTAPKGP